MDGRARWRPTSGGIQGHLARAGFPMKVTINGAEREVPEGLTLRALVLHLGLGDGPVAVEHNREIVPRAEHDSRQVSRGDRIEIVHFVGGG